MRPEDKNKQNTNIALIAQGFKAQLEKVENRIFNNKVIDILNVAGFKNISDNKDRIKDYFAFQGNYYIGKNLQFLPKADLSAIYNAKNEFSSQRAELAKNFTKALQGTGHIITSTVKHKSATTPQTTSEVFFKHIGDQSIGNFSVGSNAHWCYYSPNIVTKMRFYSSDKDDLVCITSTSMFVTSFNFNAFSEAQDVMLPMQPALKDTFFIGDFNGDGRDDIGGRCCYPHYTTFYTHTYTHNAPGGMSTWQTYNYYTSWCAEDSADVSNSAIYVGDFNGDGKDDLWCFNKVTGSHSILFNNYDKAAGISGWTEGTAFSLNGVSWCKGGQIYVGDFNKDGKSDVSCFKDADNSMTLQYAAFLGSLGDGRFISLTNSADGTVDATTLSTQFSNWDDGMSYFQYLILQSQSPYGGYYQTPVYANFTSQRLKVGDFDGDGLSDLLHIRDDGEDQILFGSLNKLFISRSGTINGQFNMDGLYSWCDHYETDLVVGDFNGDGKSDIVCGQYIPVGTEGGYNYSYLSNDLSFASAFTNLLMISQVKPTEVFISPKAVIRISDFYFDSVSRSDNDVQILERSITCDNRVRPDDQLRCDVYHTLNLKIIDTISSNAFIRKDYNLSSEIFYNGPAHLHINVNNTLYERAIDITTTPKKAFGNHSVDVSDSFKASSSMLIKSGECITVGAKIKYLPDLVIPYTATAYFKGEAGGTALYSESLLSLAKQSLYGDTFTMSSDEFEVLVPVQGQIKANIALDSYSSADNC